MYTHFDLLPAGNALSTIVQYIIDFAFGADFEGGDGNRIALEAMRNAPIARSAGVWCAQEI